MKPSIEKRVLGSESYWDGDEIAVAEILVELLELIPTQDFSKPSVAWGSKRRRSAISQSQFSTPPEQPPPVAVTSGDTSSKNNAAVSPDTPLMFSANESYDKDKTPSRVSVSRRTNKEELVQNLTDLTHQKDSLVKEMEAVKRHLDNLKASNVELKNRNQVIIYGLGQPGPALQTLHHQQHHHHHHLHLNYHHQQQQQQAFQLQQYPAIQWSNFAASSQSRASSAMVAGKMGPVGLPDLNLSLEEAGDVEGYQPSDAMTMIMDYNVNRALASAQARKRRMQIYKEKNMLRHR